MNDLSELYRKFIFRIADFIARKHEKGSTKHDVIHYFALGIADGILKTSMYLLLAWRLGILPYTSAVMAGFAAIKLFSFGMHFENNIVCILVSSIAYLGIAYLLQFVPEYWFMPWARMLIWWMCYLLVAKYAPAEDKTRRIFEHEIVKFKVRSMCAMALVGTAIILFSVIQQPILANCLLFGALFQCICLLPWLLKKFNRTLEHNNKKEENNG